MPLLHHASLPQLLAIERGYGVGPNLCFASHRNQSAHDLSNFGLPIVQKEEENKFLLFLLSEPRMPI
jgi:hypothetical protein